MSHNEKITMNAKHTEKLSMYFLNDPEESLALALDARINAPTPKTTVVMLMIAIDQAVKSLPTKEKFLFFDSINTLQVFNNPGTVMKFVHFLAAKIREWKVKGIIILISSSSDEPLTNELVQFCDTKIEAGGA